MSLRYSRSKSETLVGFIYGKEGKENTGSDL